MAVRAPGAEQTGPRFDEEAEPPSPVSLPGSRPFVDDTAALLARLCSVAAGKEPDIPSGADHLRTLALVHASVASAGTASTVNVPEFAARYGIAADGDTTRTLR